MIGQLERAPERGMLGGPGMIAAVMHPEQRQNEGQSGDARQDPQDLLK
jgi:hypothetical protein